MRCPQCQLRIGRRRSFCEECGGSAGALLRELWRRAFRNRRKVLSRVRAVAVTARHSCATALCIT